MRRRGHVLAVFAVLLAAAAGAGAARAEDREPESLSDDQVRAVPGGFEMYFGRQGTLRVRKDGRSGPLRVGGGTPYDAVLLAVGPDTVTVTNSFACSEESETFTPAQLGARIDNAEGLTRLRAGRFEEAAALLARASSADPGFDLARRNHAAALAALGRTDAAAAALAPMLVAAPLATYLRIMSDDDYAPLRDHPLVRAVQAGSAGNAQVDAHGALPGAGIAVSPRGWIATVEVSGSEACYTTSAVVIRDAATLAVVGGLPLLEGPTGPDCDSVPARLEAAAAPRIAAANRILAALGFELPPGAERTSAGQGEAGRRRLRFPASHLGVVLGPDGAVRVFRNRKLVAEHPPATAVVDPGAAEAFGYYLPGQRRILLSTLEFGCEWAELTGLVSIPAP